MAAVSEHQNTRPAPGDIDRTSRFRRRAAGLCILGFPLLQLAASAVLTAQAPAATDSATHLARADGYAGALLTSKLLFLISTALFVPAVFGLLHLVNRRGAALGHVGAFFGVLGALGHTALVIHTFFLLEMPAGDATEMVALLERLNEGATGMVVFPLLMSFGFAVLFLGIGLRRAGVLPWWGLGAIVAAFLLISPAGAVPWVETLQAALVAAAYGFVGVKVLRMGDRRWVDLYCAPRP